MRVLSPDEVTQLGLSAAPPQADEPEGPTELQAGVRGGVQGLSLGFADEAGGALQALWAKSKGDPHEFGKLYAQFRDGIRANDKSAEEAHPTAYGVGKFAGSVVPALATAGESLPAQLAAGALMGGANALGESKDLSTAPQDVATGAVFGAAGAGLGNLAGRGASAVIGKVAPKASQALDNLAINQGRRAITGGAESMSSKSPISDEAVRAAFEEGGIPWIGNVKTVARNLDDVRSQLGTHYGDILDQLEAHGVTGPDAQHLADQLFAKAKKVQANSLGSPVPGLYNSRAEELAGKAGGDLPLSQAENIKRDLQTQARYGLYNETPSNEARKDIASMFRKGIEDRVDSAGLNADMDLAGSELNPAQQANAERISELSNSFRPVKERLGNIIEASNAADKGAGQAARRNAISVRDVAIGAGALAHGNPLHAAEALGLSHVARTYGNVALAKGAYTLSKSLGKVGKIVAANPTALGRYGAVLARAAAKSPQDLAEAHFTLAQTSPIYQQVLKDLDEQVDETGADE